jgi:hypothetical protein
MLSKYEKGIQTPNQVLSSVQDRRLIKEAAFVNRNMSTGQSLTEVFEHELHQEHNRGRIKFNP